MASFEIDYKDGVWFTHLPRSAEAATQQLKDHGWKFHWGDSRDYFRCSACAANIAPFARFTWLAERAAPFRDHFTQAAEQAFLAAKSQEHRNIENVANAVDRSFSVDDSWVTIDTPAPSGLAYRPYQRAGIQWIVERQSTLLADPPGLGKTIQVLGAINYLTDIKEVLVIAPSSLAANWVKEAKKWMDRPVNAVFIKDSLDLPPLAKAGEVNLLAMTYDRVPKTTGADIKEVLNKKSRLQTSNLGLRRALQKVYNRPSLRRILVVSDGQPIAWSEAMSARLSATIGNPRFFVCEVPEQLEEAQRWMAENPSALAIAVIAPPPEQVALDILEGKPNVLPTFYRIAASFKMPGQVASSVRKATSGYDLLLKDKLYTLRTMGRGLGLVEELMRRPIDLLVIDEAHIVNNPKNATSIGIYGKEDRGKKLESGLADVAKRKVYLTGTPVRNKQCEIWNALHSLAPRTFNNFFRFAKQFCDAKETRYGWTFDGATQTAVLENQMRGGTEHQGLMIRRNKEDVLKDLPPKTRIVLPLEPPEEAEWLIAEQWGENVNLEEEVDLLETEAMIAELEGDSAKYAQAVASLHKAETVAFEEMASQRVEIGRHKVKPAAEFIDGLLDGGVDKVGIFATHHVVVEGLTAALRKHGKIAIVDGIVTGKGRVVPAVEGDAVVMERIDVVEAFQSDPEVKIFIGNFKAAKEGWTLTAASTVVMVESTWTAADNTQAEDRFHRIGTINPVTVYYLVFDGSLDQKILESVVRKMETAQNLLDTKHGPLPSKLSNVDRVKLSEAMVPTPEAPKRKIGEKRYTPEQRAAAWDAIQMISSVCDGARRRDCQGFSGRWVNTGKWLASHTSFDDRRTQIAIGPISHHWRQVPENLLEVLGIRKRGQAEQPPVRYRLLQKGRDWYVEMTTTVGDQPIQRKVLWKVATSSGPMTTGVVLSKVENAFTWDGGEVTIEETSEQVEELGIPQPKSKKAVRWKNGRWQRELADGWKDFEPEWIDDPSKAVAAPSPAKAPSPRASSPAKAPSPRASSSAKAPSPRASSSAKAPSPRASSPAKAPSKAPSARLHIMDPDALSKLGQLEGARWEREQRSLGVKLDNGFFLNFEAFKILQELGLVSPDIPLSDLDPAAGVIVGVTDIYVVMPDGEITLDGQTVDPEKAHEASKFMRVIEE